MDDKSDLNSSKPQPGVHLETRRRPWKFQIPLLGLWLVTVVFGMYQLLSYESVAGGVANPPTSFPPESTLKRAAGEATLVMIAHPRCPCTRASIGELALIMAHCQKKPAAYVLFLNPTGVSSDWGETDLKECAAAIPGVRVIDDRDGLEADRFHTQTSGQVFLYDNAGKLQFNGGITASRGHSGDNIGRDSILALLKGENGGQSQTAVFGCSLMDPDCQKAKLCNH